MPCEFLAQRGVEVTRQLKSDWRMDHLHRWFWKNGEQSSFVVPLSQTFCCSPWCPHLFSFGDHAWVVHPSKQYFLGAQKSPYLLVDALSWNTPHSPRLCPSLCHNNIFIFSVISLCFLSLISHVWEAQSRYCVCFERCYQTRGIGFVRCVWSPRSFAWMEC